MDLETNFISEQVVRTIRNLFIFLFVLKTQIKRKFIANWESLKTILFVAEATKLQIWTYLQIKNEHLDKKTLFEFNKQIIELFVKRTLFIADLKYFCYYELKSWFWLS